MDRRGAPLWSCSARCAVRGGAALVNDCAAMLVLAGNCDVKEWPMPRGRIKLPVRRKLYDTHFLMRRSGPPLVTKSRLHMASRRTISMMQEGPSKYARPEDDVNWRCGWACLSHTGAQEYEMLETLDKRLFETRSVLPHR